MKKRTFKTAKVLENKGLRPFFYAHLSLSCRLNLQADSENSSKIFEILHKKKELSRRTAEKKKYFEGVLDGKMV